MLSFKQMNSTRKHVAKQNIEQQHHSLGREASREHAVVSVTFATVSVQITAIAMRARKRRNRRLHEDCVDHAQPSLWP